MPFHFLRCRSAPSPARWAGSGRALACALALGVAPLAAADAGAAAPAGGGYDHTGRPGPWGDLLYTRILVEPPDEFLAHDYAQANAIRWWFPGYTSAQLAQLWVKAGLPPLRQQELTACTTRDAERSAMLVQPPTGLVLGLSVDARTTIYSALSVFDANPNQREPFRFRADTAREWFDQSGLAPETVTRVQQLLYRRGTSLLFSDHDLVLPLIPTRAERLKLVKTLARKSTLLVQLRVTPGSDFEELSRYWAHGPRRKDVRALLHSLARRPGGTLVDIVHLLPRFARSRLFTYPDSSDHAGDANFDCHWTALNFFRDVPDDRFADGALVQQALDHEYALATEPLLLGDVLVFFRPDGKAIHSCVYVADRIVFTKNGASQMMPWVLMDLSDVIAFYPSDPPLVIRVYRRAEQ